MPKPSQFRRGKISGRVFTTLFASGLLAILLFGIPFVLRFERIQDRIESVRQTWPPAAASMKEYYSAVDGWLKSQPSMDAELLRKWEGAMQDFNRSPLHEKQILAALNLEECLRDPDLLAKLQKEEPIIQARQKCIQSEAVTLFEKAQTALANDESDWLGNITRSVLRLRSTPRWEH